MKHNEEAVNIAVADAERMYESLTRILRMSTMTTADFSNAEYAAILNGMSDCKAFIRSVERSGSVGNWGEFRSRLRRLSAREFVDDLADVLGEDTDDWVAAFRSDPDFADKAIAVSGQGNGVSVRAVKSYR